MVRLRGLRKALLRRGPRERSSLNGYGGWAGLPRKRSLHVEEIYEKLSALQPPPVLVILRRQLWMKNFGEHGFDLPSATEPHLNFQ
jgi:hypothetical protein